MVTNDAVDDAAADDRPRGRGPRRPVLAGLGTALLLTVAFGMGPAGALDRFSPPWRHDREPAASPHPGRDRDRDDRRDCTTAPVTSTTLAPTGDRAVSQTITVVVPPIVRVRDSSPHRLVVVTNSGRAPAPGDRVYVEDADGRLAEADPGLVERVMAARWERGSWCSTTEEHRSVGR